MRTYWETNATFKFGPLQPEHVPAGEVERKSPPDILSPQAHKVDAIFVPLLQLASHRVQRDSILGRHEYSSINS
jgi:hypothetical protein